MIRILDSGVVYRNPAPHIHSVHAYFPSVDVLPGRELVGTVVLGEAFEAADLRTHVVRSKDGGRTWTHEGPIYPGTSNRLTSDVSRIRVLPDGDVLAFMVRHDRTEHPDEGLTSTKTLGFVPTELMTLRSHDRGKTWSKPRQFAPPLVGPSFEMCSPVTPLQDGRLLLPTSTWKGWNGSCPNGMRMVAFVSHDNGRTWPEYVDVMRDPKQHVIFWESKIVEFSDGQLLAVAWAYDEKAARDLPNHYAVSHDGGRTWTRPASMGLHGQTLTQLLLDDERVLCVYRRMDRKGLWANISRLRGDQWVNREEQALWGAGAAGLTRTGKNMAQNFQGLRFGAPCLNRLRDGTVFVTFWCYEDFVSNIRWFKLKIG